MIGNLAGFRAYQSQRGRTVPVDDDEATIALVRGSDFVRLAFNLLVDEDDQRVLNAAYTAAGYELGKDGPLPAPGYWQSEDSGKVLTQAGSLGWSLKDANSPKADAMTPREAVARVLGAAAQAEAGTRFLKRA